MSPPWRSSAVRLKCKFSSGFEDDATPTRKQHSKITAVMLLQLFDANNASWKTLFITSWTDYTLIKLIPLFEKLEILGVQVTRKVLGKEKKG